MSSKNFELDQVGLVSVYKRRGTKKVNLRVNSKSVKVTQPVWLPFNTGLQFAIKNRTWIIDQRQKFPILTISDGLRIGKTYTLRVIASDRLRTRLDQNLVNIYLPPNMSLNDNSVLERAKTSIKKALKKESETFLGPRIISIANKYGYSFSNIRYKSMKSRWGSCNNQKVITLNIFLMMLPWELIDYVLLHELTHTKHLNHGKSFWSEIENNMPDYKTKRSLLKKTQQSIHSLY